MPRSIHRLFVVLGVLLASANALESEPYPVVIAQKFSVAAPPCTICHQTLIGGNGTVTKAFGITAMEKYGLMRLNPALLTTVLGKMEADGVDSDGDGVGDIAELRAGTDPNDGPGGQSAEPPRYGIYCSMGHAGVARASSAWWWIGAAAVWLGRRRSVGRRAGSSRALSRRIAG